MQTIFEKYSLLKHLTITQIVSGVLAVFLMTYTFYSVSRDLAQSLEDDLRSAFDQQSLTVVDIASSRVGFHIDNDVAENVRLLGQFPALQRLELENGTRDMEKVNTFAAPRVDGFVFFDAQGDFFSSYPESIKHLYSGNHSEDTFFKLPKDSSTLQFSDWIRDHNHLKMHVSAPVYNRIVDKNFPAPTNEFSGIVLAQIDFDRTIASELGRLQSNGLMHWIVDEDSGEVLYHSVLPRGLSKKVVDSDRSKLAKSLLAAFPSMVLAVGIHRTIIDGTAFSIATARSKVGPHNITVNLAYDDSNVSGLVREKTNRIYMMGLAFLLVVFIGAIITLRQMAKRQSLLTEKNHLARELALEEDKKKLSAQVFHLQKMDSLGELAAGTAHELNNALSGPMGMLSLLQMKPDMPLEKRMTMLDTAVKGMEQTRSIVEGLLRFSKSERNEKTPDDINEDIRFVVSMYRKELDHAGIHLQLHLAPNLPKLLTAHRQIHQVLLNLIANARYVLAEGDEIKIYTEKLVRDGIDGVSISVCDNGPGISPENQKRIFEPFFSTKPTGEGTGLGLSICYGIIQEHHGVLEVKSKVGEGATFRVWLPLTQGIIA
ncbi:MAG: hypothetical protein AUK35_10165 [Zetaproteobacteria bacterium CG2_30_46_52]|nr:MAG: hypothetical protein AUK35_10165 [Zetaproteobacteria bacterium CG2_30_46_52]